MYLYTIQDYFEYKKSWVMYWEQSPFYDIGVGVYNPSVNFDFLIYIKTGKIYINFIDS